MKGEPFAYAHERATARGLSARAVAAIVFADGLTHEAADRRIADAEEIYGLFRVCGAWATAQGYDVDGLRDDFVCGGFTRKQVAASIMQQMADASPHIDTAPPTGSVQNVSTMDQLAHDHWSKANAARKGNPQ